VSCLNNKDTDELLYGTNDAEIGSAEEIRLLREDLDRFVSACVENTGDVLGEIDTVSAAKDLDVIRAALGESKLDYLGFSYGTFLGTTYAALFPEKVGRFVLDGAVDPRVSDAQQSINQLAGFDLALNNYLTDCVENDIDCPFPGGVASAKAKVKDFLLSMETKTMKTDSDRKLTISSATTGLILAMYSDSYWPYLTQAFTDAFDGDGSMFLRLADVYNDRQPDGSYSGNTLEANIAINCLDSRASAKPADMAKQNKRLLAVSPILGRYWQNGALTCENWPFPVAEQPDSYAAEGAPTIFVIGTTGDPATPFQQSVDLAHEVLNDGFLITYRGEGHTAYGRSNECVSSAVDGFLIDGKIPSKEPVC
jgi:pimeloyl-ACP methyl ester carboxylesterase